MLREDVLYALERRRGELVTGGELASALGVSRTAIWKAVGALREDGNEIESLQGSGYRLSGTNDTLSERLIKERLTTQRIGRKLILLSSVRSTNQYLRELDAAEHGTVVLADGQTGGRGRRNRPFLSPKGEGVYLSVLLRPGRAGADIRLLTLSAAVAVARAVEAVSGARAGIKWVNDVFLGGKKVSGVLTEAVLSAELQELSTVVIGIGINTGNIPAEIGAVASSLRSVTGVRGVRNRLVAEVLNCLEPLYRACVEDGDARETLREYEDRLFIRGRSVTVNAADKSYPATVLGVDETGALLVRGGDGTVRPLISGEIELLASAL